MTKPNLAKQRTVTGAFSHDANTNTGRDLADCNFGNFTGTRDKVRDAGGGSDYNSLPSDRPNYYTGPDGFKLGKKVPGIDDDDSSLAPCKRAGIAPRASRAWSALITIIPARARPICAVAARIPTRLTKASRRARNFCGSDAETGLPTGQHNRPHGAPERRPQQVR